MDVSGAPGDLRFTAVAPELTGRACADKLSVTPVEPDDAEPTWQVVATDPAKCVVTLRYGEPTADFAQTAPATPLRSDVAYRVRVSGTGFSAVRDFRLTPQGVTVQD